MTPRTAIECMLERYGEPVTLNGEPLCALIQPLRRSSGVTGSLPDEYYDSLHYLYTGPVEQKPPVGGTLKAAAREYAVLRADSFLLNGEEVYAWAVLKALAPDADTEIFLEAQGMRIALAESYTEQAAQDIRPVSVWGEQFPSSVAAGAVRYELTLRNVRPEEGVDLYAAADFTVTAAGPDRRIVYSGCRWKTLAAAGGKGERALRSMELLAAAREERKDGENGG
jgi:hypothetical protein